MFYRSMSNPVGIFKVKCIFQGCKQIFRSKPCVTIACFSTKAYLKSSNKLPSLNSGLTSEPILCSRVPSFLGEVPSRFHKRQSDSGGGVEHCQQSSSLVRRSVNRMAAALMLDGATGETAFQQNFDYLLILDFEATCDNNRGFKPQEIIEFPVLKLNTRTHAVESTFHQYVRPLYNPQLTPFCTELTGIVQDMVENQPSFSEVIKSFSKWMVSEGLTDPGTRSIFVTCGDWDLKSMLPRQGALSELAMKPYFRNWINIKKSYADVTRTFPKGMMFMLTGLGLQHVGRHHSGIDDCRNIANIAIAMMKQGYTFRQNGRLDFS